MFCLVAITVFYLTIFILIKPYICFINLALICAAVPAICFLINKYGSSGAARVLNIFELYQYIVVYKKYKYIFFSVLVILNYTILPYIMYTQLLLICLSMIYNVIAIIFSDENGHKPLKSRSSPWSYPITYWVNSAFFIIYRMKQAKSIASYKVAFYAVSIQKLIGYSLVVLNGVHVLSKCIFLTYNDVDWTLKHKTAWVPIILYTFWKKLKKELSDLAKKHDKEAAGMTIYNDFKVNGFMDHAFAKIAALMLEKNIVLNNTIIPNNAEYEVKKITEVSNKNIIHWGIAPKTPDSKLYNTVVLQTHHVPKKWLNEKLDTIVENHYNKSYNLLALIVGSRMHNDVPSIKFISENYKNGESEYITENLRKIPSIFDKASKILVKKEDSDVIINKNDLDKTMITDLTSATLLGINYPIFLAIKKIVEELKAKYSAEEHMSVEEIITKLQHFSKQDLEYIALNHFCNIE